MNRSKSKLHYPIVLFEQPKLGNRDAIRNREAIPVSLSLLQEILLQNQFRSEDAKILIESLQASPCVVTSLARGEVDGGAESA